MKKLIFSIITLALIIFGNLIFAQGMGGQINHAGNVSLDGATLDKYVDPLPNFANNRVDGTQHLTVTMKEFYQKVLPSTFRSPISRLSSTVPSRKLLLWETTDAYGRIMPVLDTVTYGKKLDMEPVTETPLLNSTEIWEIYNTTVDVHPMHLHLVSFQTINRQEFTAIQDPSTVALTNIRFTGPPIPPKPYELGWKDTKVMYPGEVTRIIARFDKSGLYVWHCHILSHEDNDMMRPFRVVTTLPKEYALPQNNLPVEFSLGQNYPNPFNPITTINFSIPENIHITLKLYDILVKEIATLINYDLFAGTHEVRLDASNLPSGIYIYKILAGKNSDVKKLMLMK